MIEIEKLIGCKFYYTHEDIIYEVYELIGDEVQVFWYNKKRDKLIEIKKNITLVQKKTGSVSYASLNICYNADTIKFIK